MPAKAKYTPAEKAKLLKQTAKLSPKEAAEKLDVTVNTLNKWRKGASSPSVVEAVTESVKAPKAKVTVVKSAPKINGKTMKQTIKAVASIGKSLEVLNKFLEQVA